MPLVDPRQKNSEGFNPNVDNREAAPESNAAEKALTYLSFILIIPIFIYIAKRNTLVKLQVKINSASSGIDVQLKKRKDVLVKMIDATKGQMKFEKSVMTDITKLRSGKSVDSNEEMTIGDNVSRVINVQLENYPDLKATQAFAKLMNTTEEVELEIAASRRLYNTYVNQFNSGIFTWPGSIVAASMKLRTMPFFAASESDKTDVKMDFNIN